MNLTPAQYAKAKRCGYTPTPQPRTLQGFAKHVFENRHPDNVIGSTSKKPSHQDLMEWDLSPIDWSYSIAEAIELAMYNHNQQEPTK